jgi:hypothetical protein
MSDFHINSFVKRQTPDSSFTHFEGEEEQFLKRVEANYQAGNFEQGYREGVILVVLTGDDTDGFQTPLKTLAEGDELVGAFKVRREGETPRITVNAKPKFLQNRKQPCERVEIVCYSHDVLAEDKENETDKPWEIISINGCPTNEPVPINPDVLMHNHFGSDGGTQTNMTPEQFEEAMRESFNYWKDKALAE